MKHQVQYLPRKWTPSKMPMVSVVDDHSATLFHAGLTMLDVRFIY